MKYAAGEENEHWLAVHSEKHIALICECGFTSISVCSFEVHLRKTHKLELQYYECVNGFLYRQLPAFKTLHRCNKSVKFKGEREKNCYFQSVYPEVVQWHSCEEQLKGFAIEIMEEPLFYDAIRQKRKPERGFPLVRNPRFVPPAGKRFVNEEPYNAEDESNFTFIKEVIFRQNKTKSQTPKRRPPTPARSTSADKKYSSVAKTPALSSTKVPQTSATLKTSMQTFSVKPKKRLSLFEMQLHKADIVRKIDNLALPKESRRNLSPVIDPEELKPDQLAIYAKHLEAKMKKGILKLSEVHRTATTESFAVIDPPKSVPGKTDRPQRSWLENGLDKRLTPAEHELLHQDTDRKLTIMVHQGPEMRDLSPIPDLSRMIQTEVDKLKVKLRQREASGAITPRPVTQRQPAAKSRTRSETKVETLTQQQEDALLASPTRSQSKSPPRPATQSQEHSDMDVDAERGRSRRKKKNKNKRPRPESTPASKHIKPIGRVQADEVHRSKRAKHGSRPITPVTQSQAVASFAQPPPGLNQPGLQHFTLRRDLLEKLVFPSIGHHKTSPMMDFRIIERTPRFACYTGSLICSNTLGATPIMQIHFLGEIEVGQYAFCNLEGHPMSLAAITFSEGSPFTHTNEIWSQFNPFGYPVYAWLLNLNTRPYQVWFTFTMQKCISEGVYRLIKLPHALGDMGLEVHLTKKNLDFGNPSFLRLS